MNHQVWVKQPLEEMFPAGVLMYDLQNKYKEAWLPGVKRGSMIPDNETHQEWGLHFHLIWVKLRHGCLTQVEVWPLHHLSQRSNGTYIHCLTDSVCICHFQIHFVANNMCRDQWCHPGYASQVVAVVDEQYHSECAVEQLIHLLELVCRYYYSLQELQKMGREMESAWVKLSNSCCSHYSYTSHEMSLHEWCLWQG